MKTTRERYTKREKAARARLIEAATELASWTGMPSMKRMETRVPVSLLAELYLANNQWQEAQLAHHEPCWNFKTKGHR